MMIRSNLGIRGLLLLLIAFSVLPLSIMQIFHIQKDRKDSIAILSKDVDQTGQIVSSQVATIVDGARNTLTILSPAILQHGPRQAP